MDEGPKDIRMPSEMALYLMSNHSFITFMDDKKIYYYDPGAGIYKPGGDELIETYLSVTKPEKGNRFCSDIKFHVRARSFVERSAVDADKNLIFVNNGILNLNENTLMPFAPEIISLKKLPTNYDPEKKCPIFLKFVSEIIDNTDIPPLQEFFGYCLYRYYPIHKSFMLIGGGSNGKTTLLETLRAFLGEENCSSERLQSLASNRFSSSRLYGKLANIFADISHKALNDTDTFKTLAGNDTISAEKKGVDGFDFKNYAKLIFSCNQLPRSKDRTRGYFRKWLIMRFPNVFDDATADKNLPERLRDPDEMSGVLNWAIEGLQRLLKQGSFTNSKNAAGMEEEYMRLSDPVAAFFLDVVERDPNGIITLADLHHRFSIYCSDEGLKPCAIQKFGNDVVQYAPWVGRTTKTENGHRMRAWRGIRIKTDEELEAGDKKLEDFGPKLCPNCEEMNGEPGDPDNFCRECRVGFTVDKWRRDGDVNEI